MGAMFWMWIGWWIAFWAMMIVIFVKRGIPGEREMKKERERKA